MISKVKPQYTSTVQKEAEKYASFDDADHIIFKVYEWKPCKETYEELCNMPFDAFCKLYERATMHEAFQTEYQNFEIERQRMNNRKR